MRLLPASLTIESFMTPVHKAVKSIIIPYMLAGMGSGMSLLSSSPTSDIARIISNCIMYFIGAERFFRLQNYLKLGNETRGKVRL